ncbi:hypothetical protein [Curtobacterium sp. MCSS17_015]|uniref:hypothetical protein n=1 Tax=Curtobacterium sp. MCSS17_015 TaxID=2175666 RepID=UPI000DA8EE6D|nr:hypothetical protein [Curtobacterium sp. MCSS17_015]WIB25421.1 hypothetical protein DEJ18_10165 [Curtobacterium sp. MCSS17_015]
MFDPFNLSTAMLRPRLRFTGDGGDGGGGGNESTGGDGGGQYTPPATQEDLNRIIESRLAREREKFKDYDDLKAAKGKYDEHLESQKTEQQKAVEAARVEASGEVTQQFLSKLVNTEVKAIAATLGFNDPTDALQIIGSDLPVKDNEPDTDEIKKRVEKLATDKAYLVGGTRQRQEPRRERRGEPVDDDKRKGGKSKAAAALRQLGAARRGS